MKDLGLHGKFAQLVNKETDTSTHRHGDAMFRDGPNTVSESTASNSPSCFKLTEFSEFGVWGSLSSGERTQ